jgi:Regulator of chromosome condensation (RCC1) repeat
LAGLFKLAPGIYLDTSKSPAVLISRILMKNLALITVLVLCVVSPSLLAQNNPASANSTNAAYAIMGRNLNSRVWGKIVNTTNEAGQVALTTNTAYVEVASGLSYSNSAGQLVDSSEEIDVVADGALATNAAHRVHFATDINTSGGSIDLQSPTGQRFKSRVYGISYWNTVSGSNVLLAPLQDANGLLVGTNIVLYTNAFQGLQADVEYILKKSGMEQNIIFREQLPDPATVSPGFTAQNTRVQVITEFFAPPEPQKKSLVRSGIEEDTFLDFGDMAIGMGKAFALSGQDGKEPRHLGPVSKHWRQISGRDFLFEEVPYQRLTNTMQTLPAHAAATNSAGSAIRRTASLLPLRPQNVASVEKPGPLLLAKAMPEEAGVVVDYATIDDCDYDDYYVFSSDETYWVSDLFYANEAEFGSGAVLKFSAFSAVANIGAAPFYFSDAATDPVVCTSVNDNSVGETISGSTGSPSTDETIYLVDGDDLSEPGLIISHVRFMYAGTAYEDDNDLSHTFNDCQFLNCAEAIYVPNDTDIYLQNVLLGLYGNGVEGAANSDLNVHGLQVTANECAVLSSDGYSIAGGFTNSIFTACDGSESNCVEDHTTDLSVNAGVYTSGGNNNYYLISGSTDRGTGTSAIDLAVLSEIHAMTTYAPQYGSYPNTGAPDRGYHYPTNTGGYGYDDVPDSWEMEYFGSAGYPGNDLDELSAHTLVYDYDHSIDPVSPPLINSAGINPKTSSLYWFQSFEVCYAVTTNNYIGTNKSSYQWQLDGTNIPGAIYEDFVPTQDGTYTVVITNRAGSTNVSWQMRIAAPGMAEAWGDDTYGQCDRPMLLTNASAIAAGEYQSVALTDGGTVAQWGQYWDGTNFYAVNNASVATQPPAGGLVAVAAGLGQCVGLSNNGTITAWGLTDAYGSTIPSGITTNGIKAVACGWDFDVALYTNGTVQAWGLDATNLGWNLTQVPPGLINVIAIAAGGLHTLALTSSNTVIAWGYDGSGECDVPAGLANGSTNVVAIAAADYHSMALTAGGKVVCWGDNSSGQLNAPAGLSNVMAIAAGASHSLALKNDGTLVAWGDNNSGQTNIPPSSSYYPVIGKLIAAGGNHNVMAISSALVQYPVDVSKDLLVIYNANSIDSSNVCQYYLTNRPMVGVCTNLVGVSCSTQEGTTLADYTNNFCLPIINWLFNNPTKRPAYVVLFQEIPSRVTNSSGGTFGVQVDLFRDFASSPLGFSPLVMSTLPVWMPFVTSINMDGTGGTNDCIAYINKLANIGNTYSQGKLIISASAGGYSNNNWYFDGDSLGQYSPYYPALEALEGAESNGVPTSDITYIPFSNETQHIAVGTNVAGYFSWGVHGGFTGTYPVDSTVTFTNDSVWYIIETAESYNGQRTTSQGNFLEWYSSNAFGGSNYSNTPVGAVSNVDEPDTLGLNLPNIYFGSWAVGRILAYSAWNSFPGFTDYLQVVGDPFVKK